MGSTQPQFTNVILTVKNHTRYKCEKVEIRNSGDKVKQCRGECFKSGLDMKIVTFLAPSLKKYCL
jgi:hypothetical protein